MLAGYLWLNLYCHNYPWQCLSPFLPNKLEVPGLMTARHYAPNVQLNSSPALVTHPKQISQLAIEPISYLDTPFVSYHKIKPILVKARKTWLFVFNLASSAFTFSCKNILLMILWDNYPDSICHLLFRLFWYLLCTVENYEPLQYYN